MKSEEFAAMPLVGKWLHIANTMSNIVQAETAFSLRRRYNTHHSDDQVRQETLSFRVSQYEKWCEIKDLYAEHRDELANTLDDSSFKQCKDILEKIFTVELDEALRSTLEE